MLGQEQSTKSPRHRQKQPVSMELILAAAGYGLPPEEKVLKGARVHEKGQESYSNGDITGIVLLMCDMMHMQHEARKREAPEGECCICIISHTKRTMSITYISVT